MQPLFGSYFCLPILYPFILYLFSAHSMFLEKSMDPMPIIDLIMICRYLPLHVQARRALHVQAY